MTTNYSTNYLTDMLTGSATAGRTGWTTDNFPGQSWRYPPAPTDGELLEQAADRAYELVGEQRELSRDSQRKRARLHTRRPSTKRRHTAPIHAHGSTHLRAR